MTKPIITLLSDFGMKDPYVAEIKAVILNICPKATLIDVSHQIEKFNVRKGAFVLASAAPYFQEGTIHVAVVDPGVGTKRHALLVETSRAFYIGPDNGLLMLAAQKDGIRNVHTITNSKLMLPKVSSTFHGRDVFAPAAAHLANGTMPSDFGPKLSDYAVPSFVRPVLKDGKLMGEILHIDDFGNIITNVSAADVEQAGIVVGSRFRLKLKGEVSRIRLGSTYGETHFQKLLALIGSYDFLEIAINQGNASKRLKGKTGDSIIISS